MEKRRSKKLSSYRPHHPLCLRLVSPSPVTTPGIVNGLRQVAHLFISIQQVIVCTCFINNLFNNKFRIVKNVLQNRSLFPPFVVVRSIIKFYRLAKSRAAYTTVYY